MRAKVLALVTSLTVAGTAQAQWDTVVGDVSRVEGYDQHWVSVRRGSTIYLVDADEGEVGATLAVSSFTPAIAPDIENERIYAYGSYYTREHYGDRTDLVMVYDAATAAPAGEVEIPPRSAGIGHPGMIGLINEQFIGVWNITPATSISLVDTESLSFVGEVALPSCSGVYPAAQGWVSVCGDGSVQYVELDQEGQEARRVSSEPFFDVFEDPVYDYSVPAADGWMFMSLEGLLRKVSFDGSSVIVSEPFDINPESDGEADVNGYVAPADDHWRISGRQPFAWHDEEALLVTLMHENGGQEIFEKPGTEVWGYNMLTGNRGYRLSLGEGVEASNILMTPGDNPLLVIGTNEGLQIRDPRSGRLLRSMDVISGGTLQSLYEGVEND